MFFDRSSDQSNMGTFFLRQRILSCCPGWLCCTSCGYPRPEQTRPLHPGYGDLMRKPACLLTVLMF